MTRSTYKAMNILFFLMPKSEVAYLFNDMTMRQVIEKFDYYKYSSMPILDRKGKYVGTITEGDVLRQLCKMNLDLRAAEEFPISSISRRTDNESVRITANMEDIISKAVNQNFIPVVDDNNIFIGIITRKSIIEYFYIKSCSNEM